VHVRVVEAGQDAPATQVDDLRARERRLVHADAAGDQHARDRDRAGKRELRVERADHAVVEDHAKNLTGGGTVLDHVKLIVRDFETSRGFYEGALAPLGLSVLFTIPGAPIAGLGVEGRPFFWISQGAEPTGSTHVAFRADDRGSVDAFHAAALAAGGSDNGRPGLREHYHPTYYGAFVHDPDGNNVEAVCHTPA
jgi:catechol 2,3-dioxygenase-like lactoylglutathione lyase family enzyme